jgi:hypothetical protein
MVFLIMLMLWAVGLGSGSSESYCPRHGRVSCPICGSELVVVEHVGSLPRALAVAESRGFRCFLGCLRVDLHDKVVDGVNHRGKVYIKPVFDDVVKGR